MATMAEPGNLAGLKHGQVPTDSQLEEISSLLEASLIPSGDVQRRVLESLRILCKRPGFLASACRIFAECEEKPAHVRQSAGICTKNLLRKMTDVSEEELSFLMMHAGKMLGHPAKVLQHTAGGILATLMKRKFETQVLVALWQNLFVDSADVVEGSLWALALICEDLLAQSYGVDESFMQLPCQKVLPRLIELTDVRLPGWLRKQASDLLLQFLVQGAFDHEKWPAAEALQGRFLASWGSLAASPDPELVQNACQGFCSVLEQRWAALFADHVGMILSFMLSAGRHEDDEVRREALAVWRVAPEASALHQLLEQSLLNWWMFSSPT